ncbi:hypothetical protein AAFF_G00425770 [Aldrovandia affinis]|uniref:protein-serine/threonine phosphatase n=1 Tax=Aldrovandia affinis TaxID=143900 RepID=A0AAD7T806_9TELE|nr:hypothetical protein AAFF_G00425770 [Aldrovandia affinis]
MSGTGNLISHIFRENEVCRDVEWERYFCYKDIEVPEIYSGPHLTFPLTVTQAGLLVEAFKNKKLHGKRILKLLHKIFSWLPLATVIDQKVLILHGGISDTTDLGIISKVDRHRYVSVLRPPKKKRQNSDGQSPIDSEIEVDVWAPKNIPVKWRWSSLTCGNAFGSRNDFQRRSLQDFSDRLKLSEEEEMEPLHRQARLTRSCQSLDLDSSLCSSEHYDADTDEWKQIVDVLWSDPMPQDGCIPNEVRGGGCYWGPDVTEEVLNKHNLQLIIRSHECKQEGYEFCHNRKVVTIFSASNYYEVGSNRGAYIQMGPDLVPHFIQYQASDRSRGLRLRQSVGRTEHSALRVLREQLIAHRSDLLRAFQEYDPENTGFICQNNWAMAVEKVLRLNLPWRVLRPQLVSCTPDGMLDYQTWFSDLAIKEPDNEHVHQSLLETLYRHRSTLETIFRIVDTDNSGVISFEDFHQTWKLLSSYLHMEISDEVISNLVASIDSSHDGSIGINQFMESFRLVDMNRLERGQSMFLNPTLALFQEETKSEGPPPEPPSEEPPSEPQSET